MSLDLDLVMPSHCDTCRCVGHGDVFSVNITHNLGDMFREAGVYKILWHGDGIVAGEQVIPLKTAFNTMVAQPDRFKKFSPPNGWGDYEVAIRFLSSVITACERFPTATFRC